MTPDEVADVRADIWAEPWKDPQLFPDCLHKVVAELGTVATGGVLLVGRAPGDLPQLAIDCEDSPIQRWAADLLRRLQDRARSGVPFDEPYGDQPPTDPEAL